ncbi:MAG: SDR family oxidoreductase [Actinomycetota bacterium]|nr:SDR family oxidoreductase [Actinomycetota bacterium]
MTRPVALVTGASVGIGEQFARILAERSHDLVLVARDKARLDALAKELQEQHRVECEVLAADLTDAAQLAAVEARAETVDVLVNNAGFGTTGRFDQLDVDGEDREIRLNVLALSRLTHAAARGMVERGSGGILNVASIAALQPGPTNATYSATKAFVLSFTEAIHEELKGTGVSVTCLAPGFTRSEFQQRAGYDEGQIPGFLWQEADVVARAGLDGLARNKAVVLPGALNKAAGIVLRLTPHSITRRGSGVVSNRIVKDA